MMETAAFRWTPLDTLDWDRIAAAFGRCYEGYVIPVRMAANEMQVRFAAEDLDLSASFIVADDEDVAALGFVARRGRQSRLAAFGVAPPWRGRGVAAAVLSRIVAEAEARGDAAMELEVFGHNEPAVRLYRRHGFEQVDRLLGFEKQSSPDAVRIGGCEVVDVSHMPADAEADPFLPWQLQSATLRRLPMPWQLIDDGDGAFALVDLSKDAAAQLRFLYTTPELRRQGRARRLLAAVERQAVGRPIRVAQLVPHSFEPFMRRLGFGVAEHFQWRMVWKPSKG